MARNSRPLTLVTGLALVIAAGAAYADDDEYQYGKQQYHSYGPAPETTDGYSGYIDAQRQAEAARQQQELQQRQQQQMQQFYQNQRQQQDAEQQRLRSQSNDPAYTNNAQRAQPPQSTETEAATDATDPASYATVTMPDSLNLRVCPQATALCEIIAEMPTGLRVKVLGMASNGWLKVQTKVDTGEVVEGYASGKWLRRD